MTHYVCSAMGALCAAALLAGCGSSDGPTGPGSVPRLLQQGNFALAAPTEDGVFFGLTTIADSAPGRWEATVDWRVNSNTLWMWVANGVCTIEQFARPECPSEPVCPCQFTVRSEVALPKPRVLTIPDAAGGTRTLIVANLGPGDETVEYSVMLTSSGLLSGSTPAEKPSGSSGVAVGQKPTLGSR